MALQCMKTIQQRPITLHKLKTSLADYWIIQKMGNDHQSCCALVIQQQLRPLVARLETDASAFRNASH